ncbi:hypothetical protein IHO40_04660 [Wolbachia endosymbiont of Mansonella ozzardi]|uniref:type II toxin-antitoxin system RelE family toxin n=1 Tax=Wolbachia endosymbiont of Mansonella ozzardi TaxID=137464 RepID=UPI001CE21FE7|nr:hypothetical protein [Wolbachia endosymbiont of Mansonella ozzardi]MCA4775364.1 hypothetical protein [Wolbachia endosymbiont of Mansonella ozzardi]
MNLGEPLYHSFKGHRRLGVGVYRIVNIEEHAVIIVAAGHGDTIYKEALKIINTIHPSITTFPLSYISKLYNRYILYSPFS